MSTICRRCYVEGRVQGVFYRATAARTARDMGITGYARNLSDGRVEILACGEPSRVDDFCDWLWQGSAASRVTAVHCEDAESEAPEHFVTR